MRILIADDDPGSVELLKTVLEQRGHEVQAAEGGPRAWEVYKATKPPLLILDWMMPELDGPTLCRRIRDAELADQLTRYSYIILLTALSGTQNLVAGIQAGADDFMTKPFKSEELFARIQVADRIMTMQQRLKRLEGLLNVCSYCRKIREEDGHWVQMEAYISRRSEAAFSHGVCPVCFDEQVQPQLDRLKKDG